MQDFARKHALPMLGLLALIAAGCGSSSSGGGGGDDDAGTGGSGGGCDVGTIGCACDDGTCSEGECANGMCVAACERGAEGCDCLSNGACDADLVCTDGTCAPCTAGTEQCECDGDSCNAGLMCMNGVCTPETCAEGTETCPCGTGGSCAGDLYCDDNTICRACASDVEGCPCERGACGTGLTCESGVCQVMMTTPDAGTDGGTDAGPEQDAGTCADEDGGCTADDCTDDEFFDPVAGLCRACVSAGCANEPSCDAADENSIVDTCSGENKTCVEDSAGARCEGCVDGALSVGDACVFAIVCGGGLCEDDEYCDTGSDSCKELPCPEGQARAANDSCVDCTIACSGTGLTGRPWPFQNNEDECICETLPGYYMPTESNTQPEACDADGDGWVRKEADTAQINNDEAHLQNARCEILRVDGVILRDEYGIEMEVGSCGSGEGLVVDPEGQNADDCQGDRIPMRLLESSRNDVPGEVSPTDNNFPPYDHDGDTGSGGRQLVAREVTALTKACVTAVGDFNDNGANDLTEKQDPSVSSDDDQTRLESFSYFTELYRAWYQAPVGTAPHGKLVIAERTRCDLDNFFLGYSADDVSTGYSTMLDGHNPQYWRNCQRRRDADYNASIPRVGMDFAQWSCAATSGSCDAVQPAHPSLDASTFDYTARLLRGHGLCELGDTPPVDGLWRGMGHHSQFKCVQIGADAPAEGKYPTSSFEGANPQMILNFCEATDNTIETAPDSHSYSPQLACARHDPAQTVPAGTTVAWAAVNFIDYGSYGDPSGYERSCISEDAEWGEEWLCHYPQFALNAGGFERQYSYGRYSCGEDQAFLWAAGDATDDNAATLWWDGPNGASPSVNSVLR